jgi:hypothetical protein
MSAPFLMRLSLFVVGLILCIDAILLLSYRKIHLGVMLPLFIGLIFCIYAVFNVQIQTWLNRHLKFKKLWRFGWGIFIVWLMTLFAFFIFLTVQIQHSASIPAVKSIIVLGSGIENGQPSAALAKRLDRCSNCPEPTTRAGDPNWRIRFWRNSNRSSHYGKVFTATLCPAIPANGA